jgi:hypothetical protein
VKLSHVAGAVLAVVLALVFVFFIVRLAMESPQALVVILGVVWGPDVVRYLLKNARAWVRRMRADPGPKPPRLLLRDLGTTVHAEAWARLSTEGKAKFRRFGRPRSRIDGRLILYPVGYADPRLPDNGMVALEITYDEREDGLVDTSSLRLTVQPLEDFRTHKKTCGENKEA